MTKDKQKLKKRKKGNRGSSGSDSQQDCKPKHFKPEDPTSSNHDTSISVSELLNQTNSILYDSSEKFDELDELDNSVFFGLSSDQLNPQKTPKPPKTPKQPKTPKSNSKEIKMASSSNPQKQANVDSPVSDKLDTLIKVVQDLKIGQEGMKRMFESKLDKLKTDLIASVDNKIKTLRDEISLDLARETNRTDQITNTIQSIQSRIDNVEEQGKQINSHLVNSNDNGILSTVQPLNPSDNNEITITASGIPVTEHENLIQKAESLISALGDEVTQNVRVTGVVRLPTRSTNRPGIVKISFRNTHEKVQVLRNKMKLKDNAVYNKVYIKSSKSRIERLIKMNAHAVLRNLPNAQARGLRVDANGRIKPRNLQQTTQPETQENDHP
ncbi:unnamed protein product [Mytilus coruscus]|uniref:Uncharacterized protein n=1 Tax=Mytilus coruscus TaxID=42192 RepID=A0A6J8BCV6_MYTCO|nr:unnamed protein product [Mytilus coruscus]